MPEPARPAQQDRYLWRSFHHHSRTFSLAARLLPGDVQLPIATLYMFCRSVDTLADERVREIGAEAALLELAEVETSLRATLDGRPPDELVWQRLARVHERFALNADALFELVEGARWDLEDRPIEDRADLVAYSNLVGGSVGAMMLPFLLEGDWDPRLERPARALGIAMQITNIVRDVGEDLRELGRIYLPKTWLRHHSVRPDHLLAGPPPSSYATLVEEAMRTAEKYYQESESGVAALPLRVRPAIRAASRMYREIMNEVRALGYDNLRERAYVTLPRKLSLVLYDSYEPRRARLAPRGARSRPVLRPVVQP